MKTIYSFLTGLFLLAFFTNSAQASPPPGIQSYIIENNMSGGDQGYLQTLRTKTKSGRSIHFYVIFEICKVAKRTPRGIVYTYYYTVKEFGELYKSGGGLVMFPWGGPKIEAGGSLIPSATPGNWTYSTANSSVGGQCIPDKGAGPDPNKVPDC